MSGQCEGRERGHGQGESKTEGGSGAPKRDQKRDSRGTHVGWENPKGERKKTLPSANLRIPSSSTLLSVSTLYPAIILFLLLAVGHHHNGHL